MQTNSVLGDSQLRLREAEIREQVEVARRRRAVRKPSTLGHRLAVAVAVVLPVLIAIAEAAPRISFG